MVICVLLTLKDFGKKSERSGIQMHWKNLPAQWTLTFHLMNIAQLAWPTVVTHLGQWAILHTGTVNAYLHIWIRMETVYKFLYLLLKLVYIQLYFSWKHHILDFSHCRISDNTFFLFFFSKWEFPFKPTL